MTNGAPKEIRTPNLLTRSQYDDSEQRRIESGYLGQPDKGIIVDGSNTFQMRSQPGWAAFIVLSEEDGAGEPGDGSNWDADDLGAAVAGTHSNSR